MKHKSYQKVKSLLVNTFAFILEYTLHLSKKVLNRLQYMYNRGTLHPSQWTGVFASPLGPVPGKTSNFKPVSLFSSASL